VPWKVWGIDSYFQGRTYGFMSPTNVAVTPINVSGNVASGSALSSFINPTVNTPGMYEVSCTAVVTQTCVGATMQLGVVASNSFGFQTNFMFQDMMPLTALLIVLVVLLCLMLILDWHMILLLRIILVGRHKDM
jgi:hypothetical protein